MKKFWFASMFFLVGTIICVPYALSASSGDIRDVSVTSTSKSIEINWNSHSEYFELYSKIDNTYKKIWSGKDRTYKLNSLNPDHKYKLKLVAKGSNGEKLDNVVINTSTNKTKRQINERISMLTPTVVMKDERVTKQIFYPMANSKLDSFVKKNEVKLSWSNLPDDDQIYEVYRDGKLLKKVKGDSFTDTSVVKNNIYSYKIVGLKKIPDAEVEKKKKWLKEKGIKLNKSQEKNLYYEEKSLGTVLQTSDETTIDISREDKKQVTLQGDDFRDYPTGYGFTMRYTTFIPLEYAVNPQCDWVGYCKFHYFEGDNRGFDVWSDRFRTRSDVYITWDFDTNNPNDVKLNPSIGTTVGLDENKNPVETDQADESDIELSRVTNTGDSITHWIKLESSNPLVVGAPAIDAEYGAQVYKNGTGHVEGTHDKAPSHEFYIAPYASDGGWRTILNDEHEGFEYLLPIMPNAEFSIDLE
ncbi:DUF3238 domain-containing protein [Paludifilum halophilum]|uniref:Fibronectin type-III domain-containing protein n=1 Tax=Paludifilum halophilum TaxID=1642702 RepID=A0A235B2X9_9BACL|nr:DUF3238 domain-containing protein [Paludifilum halophilum]OYD06668.1 hypothetical protein CHM34_15295 [Paludifilum halophilum]